jgi:hypothetical protein
MRGNTMRIKIVLTAVAAGLLAAGAFAAPAAADPITCPPGQESTLNPSGGGWTCVNQGGNTNNSEDPRPPNADKGDFQKP